MQANTRQKWLMNPYPEYACELWAARDQKRLWYTISAAKQQGWMTDSLGGGKETLETLSRVSAV